MDDKEKKLYPLRFLEDKDQRPWGEVHYKIADLGLVDSKVRNGWLADNKLSELMGTYMERVVGDDSFEYYGLQFPILIKSFKTDSWQPLQVNVPDAESEARYDSFGKTAMWYVEKGSKDVRIYLGLAKDVAPGEFYERCLDSSITEVLNVVHPKAGDLFVIEPGTVFAAGPGLSIIEISECSEMTFNLQDPSDLTEAFDLINFSKYTPAPDGFAPPATVATLGHVRGGTAGEAGGGVCEADVERRGIAAGAAGPNSIIMVERNEFKVTKLDLQNPLHIFSDQPGSFAAYHCLSGAALIRQGTEDMDFTDVPVDAGEVVLVPSEVNDFFLFPAKEGTVLLETTVERRVDPDSYTGDTKPTEDTPDPHLRNWN